MIAKESELSAEYEASKTGYDCCYWLFSETERITVREKTIFLIAESYNNFLLLSQAAVFWIRHDLSFQIIPVPDPAL